MERMKGIQYETGFVYCLHKEGNIYKIGQTSDIPTKRNKQLYISTLP